MSGVSAASADEVWQFAGEETVVRLDLLPVRPDIFDAGGLARALRGYLGVETGLKEYAAAPASWRVEVDARITDPAFRRPFIQCVIVRNLSLDDELLRAIMRLQENLHWALCRDRKFASIGAYDLATLDNPIRYTLVDREELPLHPAVLGRARARQPARDAGASTPRAWAMRTSWMGWRCCRRCSPPTATCCPCRRSSTPRRRS